jgi:quercetin dioxygenase-like cupin family protein
VKIVRADEVAERAAAVPEQPGRLAPQWLEGPFDADRLDVGIVTVGAGGATPPHAHIGGQVMVVVAGRGFVETGGERHPLRVGDVVICPPGKLHVHGADADAIFSHLTVTTGGYTVPSGPAA